jgi:hypothetical protein
MHLRRRRDKKEGGRFTAVAGFKVLARPAAWLHTARMRSAPVVLFLLLGLAAFCLPLRGQITEWPETVAPGRFLVEIDAISLTIDREPGLKYTAFGAASTFVTTGLTSKWDIQVGAEFFISQKFDAAGLTERQRGVGDVYIRTKYRFYESNDTYTAAAIIPYVKIPTNSGGVGNDSVEGGVILPFSAQLLGGFNFYAMAELDFLRNDLDDGYDSYWFFSAALNRSVTRGIGIYGEMTAAKSSGASGVDGMLGAGVTLAVSDKTWWDFAFYRGISSSASDWTHVVRFNWGF